MFKHSKVLETRALSYDDVLIIPEGSIVSSRDDVDISVSFKNSLKLELPVFVAAMDSIVSDSMTELALDYGAGIFQHKNQSIDSQCLKLQKFREHLSIQTKSGINAGTVGINNSLKDVESLISSGANAILFEMSYLKVANQNIVDLIRRISDVCKNSDVLLITGNIATFDDAAWISYMFKDSIDLIKVGYGCGSTSTTAYTTGLGYPVLQSVLDITQISESFKIPVIADGGIKSPGDLSKAIAAGAIAGCVGSMFAGTVETPGDVRRDSSGVPRYKQYWGSSSSIGRSRSNDRIKDYIQGGTGLCPLRGSASVYFKRFQDGLRAAIASTNSQNILEFQKNSKFIICNNSKLTEIKY